MDITNQAKKLSVVETTNIKFVI